MAITVNQAAESLGVSTKTIYRRILSGELQAEHVANNCIRIDEADFETYRASIKARKPYTRKAATQAAGV